MSTIPPSITATSSVHICLIAINTFLSVAELRATLGFCFLHHRAPAGTPHDPFFEAT